jgi:hypothetical protein
MPSIPVSIDRSRGRAAPLERLGHIPGEQFWLDKQKSARTRRAYKLDVQRAAT